MLSKAGRVAALAVTALGAAPAKSQESTPITSVQVTANAEAYDPRRDDTASKIVLSQADLAKYGDPTVADALKRVPGVTVVTNGRGIDIRMRGLGAGYTRILVNGERAPMGLSLDSLAPAQVERIEVLRSASAEYTTESVAGIINVVLKKTVSKPQREVQLNAEKDAADRTARTLLQLADRVDKMSWTVSVRSRQTWIERDITAAERGPGLSRDTASHERLRFALVNVVPRLQWQLPNGDQLALQGYADANRVPYDADEATATQAGDAARFPLLARHGDSRSAQWKADLSWLHRLEHGGKVELKTAVQRGETTRSLHRFGHGGTAALDNTLDTQDTSPGASTSGKYFAPLGEGHLLASGFEASTLRRNESRREVERSGPAPQDSGEHSTARTRRLALFGQDEWTVTPKWSVYAGARWESLRTASTGTSFAPAASSSQIWSPILQTLYKLRPEAGDQLRFALTRTFRAPDVGDLVPDRRTSVNNSPNDPDTQGNPALKPELATGADASYEYYWARGAMLSAAVSLRRIANATMTRVSQDADGRWLASPANAGGAQTRSLELEARFPLTVLLPQAPAMDIKASVSRNWSRVDAIPGPDNRLAQQVPLSATFAVDRAAGRLTTGASFVFRGGGWSRRSLSESRYLNAGRQLDVYALWKFDTQTQLRIFLGNLLGSGSIRASRYDAVTRTVTDPGHARLRLSLEHKF
ncbi:TonB-dependent receptor plug domain-containing protein [Massilia endophytica]|uniref:TonB-dependent receptor plug domain-containing protein n=1 Tax=Massilia endophytica TaxID=2899220 RepID=UPI001E2CC8D2|nr:TonB-dependent receptor [Massilia endophytica]UGQ46852.1 TonB-dependent receptor [Massilia endophytica]